jgi:raffinose/stachyose/melibiose transport system permease protein
MGRLRFTPSVLLFMVPAAALYGLFFVVPFVRALYGSLLDWNGIGTATFIGFHNYVQLARDSLFLTGVGRVALWAALAVVFKVGTALLLASMLRLPIPGSQFFTGAFFVPVMISSAAISLLFTLLYDPDVGLVNAVLRGIGLGFLARNWLGDDDTALLAVIAVPIWHAIGYFFIILLAAMRNVPNEMYEAAKIDGANARVLFVSITAPSVWPVLQICIVLAVTTALKSFDYVFVMTNGGPGTATEVPATYMYRTIFSNLQFGYGTAMATVIFVLALGSTLIFRRLTNFNSDCGRDASADPPSRPIAPGAGNDAGVRHPHRPRFADAVPVALGVLPLVPDE